MYGQRNAGPETAEINTDVILGTPFERREVLYRQSRYTIRNFTERNDPAGALRAQQIQGESYVAAGFIYPEGLDKDGRLNAELDRSRGDEVEYYVALSGQDEPTSEGRASLRVISIPENGSLDDLPAYRYCRDALADDVQAVLQQAVAHDRLAVREIAALSKTEDTPALASYELMRTVIHDGIRRGRDEMWLITFADRAYGPISDYFGTQAIRQVGTPVAIDVGDERTSDELRLIPSIVEPLYMLDTMLDEIESDIANRRDFRLIHRKQQGIVLLADGLEPPFISPRVQRFVEKIHDEKTRPARAG